MAPCYNLWHSWRRACVLCVWWWNGSDILEPSRDHNWILPHVCVLGESDTESCDKHLNAAKYSQNLLKWTDVASYRVWQWMKVEGKNAPCLTFTGLSFWLHSPADVGPIGPMLLKHVYPCSDHVGPTGPILFNIVKVTRSILVFSRHQSYFSIHRSNF